MKIKFIHPPDDFSKHIGMPELITEHRLTSNFDYLHLFAKNQSDLHQQFPRLKNKLKPTGMLWVSWRKNKSNTDLTLTKIIEIGYDYVMVESKVISINENWSAIKFTFPKPGKIYNNSFGKLK